MIFIYIFVRRTCPLCTWWIWTAMRTSSQVAYMSFACYLVFTTSLYYKDRLPAEGSVVKTRVKTLVVKTSSK
jgi:hypothetical protein